MARRRSKQRHSLRNNESRYQDFSTGTFRSKHKCTVQGLPLGWDSPRIPHGPGCLSQPVPLCPLCLVPLLPFTAMGLEPHSHLLHPCLAFAAEEWDLSKPHSLPSTLPREVKNTTTVAITTLPIKKRPPYGSIPSRTDVAVAISWLSTLGSPRVLQLQGCPLEARRESWKVLRGWSHWLCSSEEHPRACGHLHGFYNPLYQSVSHSSSKCRKNRTQVKSFWQKSIEEERVFLRWLKCLQD